MARAPSADPETTAPSPDARVVVWAASPHSDLSADEVAALDARLSARVKAWDTQQGGVLCFMHPSGNAATRASAGDGALPVQPRYFLVNAPSPSTLKGDARSAADDIATEFAAALEACAAEPQHLVRHLTALYAPTGARPVLSRPEPGQAAGLMLGLTDCKTPTELESFQRWYDDVHAAEALAPGIFSTARRYQRQGKLPGSPEFLALYESSQPGPEALRQLMLPANKPPTPLHEACLLRAVWSFTQHPLP